MTPKNWFNSAAYEAALREDMTRKLTAAAHVVQNNAKKLISIAGTGIRQETAREAKGRKFRAKLARRRKIVRRINKVVGAYNKASSRLRRFTTKNRKIAKVINLGQIKRRRVTLKGKITSRRKGKRKKK